LHEQKEDEIYYVLSGTGTMVLDGKTVEITPGTAVLTRTGSTHSLKQTGGGLPIEWSESRNVRWKTAIHGRAWSSPVILGSQVWVSTATPDGRRLSAVALDKRSGRIVHDLTLF